MEVSVCLCLLMKKVSLFMILWSEDKREVLWRLKCEIYGEKKMKYVCYGYCHETWRKRSVIFVERWWLLADFHITIVFYFGVRKWWFMHFFFSISSDWCQIEREEHVIGVGAPLLVDGLLLFLSIPSVWLYSRHIRVTNLLKKSKISLDIFLRVKIT